MRRWPVIHLDVPSGVPKLPVLGLEPQKALMPLARPELVPYARFDIAGTDHIPAEGPAIVVGNHRSYFDPLAMAITLAGVWFVACISPSNGDGDTPSEYSPAVIRRTALYAFSAAAIYAAALSTAADRAVEIYGPLQTVLVMRIVGAVIVGIAVLSQKERMRFPLRAWPLLIGFGVLDTAGHLFIFIGLGLENGENAIITSVAYTVVTVLLARAFLREQVSALQWGGVALVVGGVALLAAFG